MRKTVLSAIAVLLGGAWATAQPSQPGVSFVNSNPRPAGPAVVTPAVATPPEPGAVGATAVPSPISAAAPAYPAYPNFPAATGPVGMPVAGPAGVPAGMAYPADPGVACGPGYPGAPGFALDPPSSFGTERIWVAGHYLLGYLTRPRLPGPLVTTGAFADIHPGAIGQPGTQVLFGEDQYQFGNLHGIRLDAGVNLNDRLYLEGSLMVFAPAHTNGLFASDPSGNPFIGRPVFNTAVGGERSYLTSAPGLVAGTTMVETRLQLYGAEAHARWQTNLTPYLSADALLGYRFLHLEEDVQITDSLRPLEGSITFLGDPITAPNTVSDFDRFSTRNRFHGVNTGLRLRWQSGFPFIAFTGHGKVAFGSTQQIVDIVGGSTATSAGGPLAAPGGVLALPSNIGRHERSVFGVIPEGGAQLVLMLRPGLRFYAGYTATYWNDVVRAGDQIDRNINPALVPTDLNFDPNAAGGSPAFTFRSRALWLQTINFGLEWYY